MADGGTHGSARREPRPPAPVWRTATPPFLEAGWDNLAAQVLDVAEGQDLLAHPGSAPEDAQRSQVLLMGLMQEQMGLMQQQMEQMQQQMEQLHWQVQAQQHWISQMQPPAQLQVEPTTQLHARPPPSEVVPAVAAQLTPVHEGEEAEEDVGDDLSLPAELLEFVERPATPEEARVGGRSLAARAAAAEPEAPEPAPLPHHRVAIDADGASEAALDAAGRSLALNGFVILESDPPLVDPKLCARCADDAVAECERLLAEVGRRTGLNVYDKRFYFSEICHRVDGGLRYDMRVDLLGSSGCWAELRAACEGAARRVIERSGLLGDERGAIHVDMQGCVTSFPSACDQHFHPDGPRQGLVNCFIPLVDVGDDNGSTELKPGTHEDDARPERVAGVRANMAAGSVLLFDFRVHHRGRAHRKNDAPRPVAYTIFGAAGAHDSHNFGPYASVFDAEPGGALGPGEDEG